MKKARVCSTPALVSFLASGLRHHAWACERGKAFRPPLLTCEPVLTEAAFLLKRGGREADPLFALLERGVVRIALNVQEEQADLRALMRRYRNRPMSLADPVVRATVCDLAQRSDLGQARADIVVQVLRDAGAYALKL